MTPVRPPAVAMMPSVSLENLEPSVEDPVRPDSGEPQPAPRPGRALSRRFRASVRIDRKVEPSRSRGRQAPVWFRFIYLDSFID